MITLFSNLYFSIAAIAIIVVADVLIKFKRPILLKFHLILILVSIAASSLIYSYSANEFIFYLALIKSFMAASFLNIFTLLYFKKFTLWVNIFSFVMIGTAIATLWYNYHYYNIGDYKINPKLIGIESHQNSSLPFYFVPIRFVFFFGFIFTLGYFWYVILFKLKYQNIYFDKIKKWAKAFLILSIIIFLTNLPIKYLSTNVIISHSTTIIVYLYLVLLIFYRPVFLNRSSLKLSFGEKFNKEDEKKVNELLFINEFYTNQYFTNSDASIENLSKKLNINYNDLYRFIYNKYSMSFNDLVNKNRIDYFIDLVHDKRFANYTIDALAKEVGFSSRQHLYKPFKKFHGGNPSNFIDAMSG